MDWWILGLIYFGIGVAVFVILWKTFNIEWHMETSGTKAMIILTIPAWPIILLFIWGVKLWP